MSEQRLKKEREKKVNLLTINSIHNWKLDFNNDSYFDVRIQISMMFIYMQYLFSNSEKK